MSDIDKSKESKAKYEVDLFGLIDKYEVKLAQIHSAYTLLLEGIEHEGYQGDKVKISSMDKVKAVCFLNRLSMYLDLFNLLDTAVADLIEEMERDGERIGQR